jgi:diguanylate cyclase (GGDEF)-like protein/putative nucleotidyltransferase with HDIG domain
VVADLLPAPTPGDEPFLKILDFGFRIDKGRTSFNPQSEIRIPQSMVFRIDMSDYNRAARAYWVAVVTAGALILAWAAWGCLRFGPAQWAQLAALASLVVISGMRPVRIPGTKASLTVGDCFIFLGAIFLGVPAAVVLGAADALTSSLSTSRRATSWIAAPACMSLTVFASARVFYFALASFASVAREPLGVSPPVAFELLALPLVLTALVQYVLNGALIATLIALKSRRPAWGCWRDNYLWTSWTFFAGAIAAGVVYMAVVHFGMLYVALCVPVIAATLATYRTYFERVAEQTREAAELSRLHLATVEALATAIDAKDQTTHCHVRRVQIYCARLGELMGLAAPEIKALKAGALLHDVGKLAVPDHILNKPGKLTEAEFDRMKIHTTVGAQILERVGFPYPVIPVVRYHHEQWDGRGYPDGLKGEEIPLTARILSVVDCFDSVREDRPYRRGMTREQACSMLRRGAGAHFDPRVVELFLCHLHDFEEEIKAQGLEHRGITYEECENRDLLGEGPEQVVRKLAAAAPSSQLAPDYLSHISNAHREVYSLYEIARTFGSSLDIEDTASVLINKVGHVVPSDLCAVYLYDDEKGYATAAHVSGRHAELLRGRAVAPGEGVVGFVLANRRASYLLDPMLDFADVELPEGFRLRSMVALPLTRGERVLGVLAAYSTEPRRYTDDHMRLLDTVARLASDALANAMSHAEAESNALTDTLTGLPNSRSMYMRFEEEAARARRTGRPFQVVMLDLDDFKQVNDTFGHRTGDRMLREVGRILQAQLREYDFLARYAGDEFVAIVQDLTTEQTEELRERIERAVSRFTIHVRGDKHARVGISIGSASYGVHGETLDQLLISADEAMYSAKSTHKQRARANNSSTPKDLNTGDLASSAIN